jgi:hypothetical protein
MRLLNRPHPGALESDKEIELDVNPSIGLRVPCEPARGVAEVA